MVIREMLVRCCVGHLGLGNKRLTSEAEVREACGDVRVVAEHGGKVNTESTIGISSNDMNSITAKRYERTYAKR